MRKWVEPSCRNLLRRPLVLGVSFFGLLSLSLLVILIQSLGQGTRVGNILAVGIGILGYLILRILAVAARPGWEERWLFALEKIFARKSNLPAVAQSHPARFLIQSPDTLDEARLLQAKAGIEERLRKLKKDQRLTLLFSVDEEGTSASELSINGEFDLRALNSYQSLTRLLPGISDQGWLPQYSVYSLVDLPVVTDPLWLSAQLQLLEGSFQVIASARGLESASVKSQIDASRKRNARSTGLPEVENDVAFDEATRVLQGLSRGDECVVEFGLIIVSKDPLDLDMRYFMKERIPLLSVVSTLGLRHRFHRSHWLRSVTAADLIPNLLDPKEAGLAVLKTARERALYFDPQDPRLPALHWLVVGATGSGKSVFVALILLRMVQRSFDISVLFIDHNRSFRRLLRKHGVYFEPQTHHAVGEAAPAVFERLNQCGGLAGIELSDLTLEEKKESTHWLLSQVESFLRTRKTSHTVYIVMDECWNFMRDEPILVQRFFREFRKLNGAAIAITQSLSDFLADDSGRSICQNAPIRILLRQDEDLAPYRGVLGLNGTEIERLRALRQEKGLFSECLIKTPFDSKLARLYPTSQEYELLRTDNIREEMIQEELNRHIDKLHLERAVRCGGN